MKLYEAFARKDTNTIVCFLSKIVDWSEPENPFNPAGGIKRGHAGSWDWLNIGINSEDILIIELNRLYRL